MIWNENSEYVDTIQGSRNSERAFDGDIVVPIYLIQTGKDPLSCIKEEC